MNETSFSLLGRLQHSQDPATWTQLVDIYTPLLHCWIRRFDIQPCDADDIVQDVLLAVAKDLGSFEHNGRIGAFRSWLRQILVHRLKHFWRKRGRQPHLSGGPEIAHRLDQLEDASSGMSQMWDREHDRYVVNRLLSLAESHFSERTWRAFQRVALEGASATEVAEELGISLNAVFIAKSRVISRLRQESFGLLESASSFSAKL